MDAAHSQHGCPHVGAGPTSLVFALWLTRRAFLLCLDSCSTCRHRNRMGQSVRSGAMTVPSSWLRATIAAHRVETAGTATARRYSGDGANRENLDGVDRASGGAVNTSRPSSTKLKANVLSGCPRPRPIAF